MSLQTESSSGVIHRVLFTEGAYPATVGMMRHLGKKDIQTWAISPSKKALASYSRYCRKCFPSPEPTSEIDYISFLKDAIRANRIDMLIPVGFQSCYVVAKYQDELRRVVALAVPKFKSVKIALNKQETHKLANKVGVTYPRTLYPANIGDIESMAQQIGYPVIVKGLYEAGRNIVTLVENKDDLVSQYIKICEENGFKPGALPILQEYIPGERTDFAAISLLYQRGKCKRLFLYRRIRNMGKLGTGTCFDCNISPQVAQQMKYNAQKLLDALNWHGVACIEFKRDPRDGLVKLIEINPKFWAATEMSLIAGINFPYHLCEMAAGKELDYSEEYNHKLKFHYALSNDLLQLRWNPRSTPRYILDLLNPKVKSDVSLTDLSPNVVQLAGTLGTIFRELVLNKISLKSESRARRKTHGDATS
jgi:predicted ATP-grasp superfamily ATP-dependent carboligase